MQLNIMFMACQKDIKDNKTYLNLEKSIRYCFCLINYTEAMMEEFIDNPQTSANHLVLGMTMDQRKQARGIEDNQEIPNWV